MTTFSHQDIVIGEISNITKYLKFIFCIRFRGLLKTPDEMLYSGHLVASMFYRDSLNQCFLFLSLIKIVRLRKKYSIKRTA